MQNSTTIWSTFLSLPIGLVSLAAGCTTPTDGSHATENTGDVQSALLPTDPHWANGLPPDAIVGGKDSDGALLYACRGSYAWGVHPGKTRAGWGSCDIGYGGQEHFITDYQTLVPYWSTTLVNAAPLGRETNQTPLFHCRADLDGEVQLGKLTTKGCSFPYNNAERVVSNFEVLTADVPLVAVNANADTPFPAQAIVGGREPDGTPIYPCIAPYGSGFYPGKTHADWHQCKYTGEGQALETSLTGSYQVLVPQFNPAPLNNATVPFIAGSEFSFEFGVSGAVLGVCSATYAGGQQLGKYLTSGACNFGYGGNEVFVTSGIRVLSEFDYPHPAYTAPATGPKRPVPSSRFCDNPPEGIYRREWMRLGGPNGPMGCSIGGVHSYGVGQGKHGDHDEGGYIQFENGQISFSPDIWPDGIVGAYLAKGDVVVDWATKEDDSDNLHFDRVNLNWEYNEATLFTQAGQEEVNTDMTTGQAVFLSYDDKDTHLSTQGTWRLALRSGWGMHEGSWSVNDGSYSVAVEGCDVHVASPSTCRQGFLRRIHVDVNAVARKALSRSTSYAIDLTGIESATSVASSKVTLDDRTAAAVLHDACDILWWNNYHHEEDYVRIIAAKLAYSDYFQNDYCPGRTIANAAEAAASLKRQHVESKTGTTVDIPLNFRTGEYDATLNGLMPIIYRYYQKLPVDVREHVINELLNKRGPLDAGDLTVPLPGLSALEIGAVISAQLYAFPSLIAAGTTGVTETENHLLNILTSQYLTNQLLFARTANAAYDNSHNGMDIVMLQLMNHLLNDDFIEYNARSYQDYSITAIQNLYSYAYNGSVKLAAQMLLDYVSAKVAVSSNDARRNVTYRRRASSYGTDMLSQKADPQVPRILELAGDTDILSAGPGPRSVDASYGWMMMRAGISDYRIPEPILDLLVNKSHRTFYQGFHHYTDELYAGSPSFLLTAGGHYATFAYRLGGVFAQHEDIGLAVATTLLPTGEHQDVNELLRFDGVGVIGKDADSERSNMCVAPNFACGLDPQVPALYTSDPMCFRSTDATGKTRAGSVHGRIVGAQLDGLAWTFIDVSNGCNPLSGLNNNGYHVAFFRDGDHGFFEARDVQNDIPGVPTQTFDEFVDQVLKANVAHSYGKNGVNVYDTTDGRHIEFEFGPDSRVNAISGTSTIPSLRHDMIPATVPQHAVGDIVQSPSAHVLLIRNPSTGQSLQLDGSDYLNPKRTLN
jgi:hypothetical protein